MKLFFGIGSTWKRCDRGIDTQIELYTLLHETQAEVFQYVVQHMEKKYPAAEGWQRVTAHAFNVSDIARQFASDPPSPLSQLWESQSQWSQATFGSDADKGLIGSLRHLRREVDEAISEAKILTPDPEDMTRDALCGELADCLLLLMDAARRGGCSLQQLIDVAAAKHEINKSRQWRKNDAGFCEHVK